MNSNINTCPRSREELIASIGAGWTPKWLLFWGHKPTYDGSISKSSFCQWWEGHPFDVDGIRYLTAEHFMMAEKARLFGDDGVLTEILAADNPGLAMKLGRKVSSFDVSAWNKARSEIVIAGNIAKFGQHPELLEFLLNTAGRVLVEASPRDRIWGIGMGANNPAAEKPEDWRGANLLGFALMAAREHLRRLES